MFINENANYSINDIMPLIEESIEAGQSVRMQVSGISMTPILHDIRDTVVLEKAKEIKKYENIYGKKGNS